jgi:prepilin-type N-terminal cleavage/methylation domain-containing protein
MVFHKNTMKKSFFNELSPQGFSLMEILIALGLLGGITLGVAQLMKQSSESGNYAEARMEENEVARQVALTLANEQSCTNTLRSFGAGEAIPAIKSAQNENLFEVGKNYSGNVIFFKSARLEARGGTIPPAGKGTMAIVLELARSKVKIGRKESLKEVQVLVTLDASSKVLSCVSLENQLANSTNKQFCEATGGVWTEGPPPKCDYSNCDVDSTDTLYSSSCFKARGVQKSGDTMTGSLTISGGKICVDSNCWDLSAKTCPDPTQALMGIDSQGNAICGTPAPPPGPPAPSAVNCQGSFTPCSKTCGGGTRTWVVTQQASGGGTTCLYPDGYSEACNTTPCLYNCPAAQTSGCYTWVRQSSGSSSTITYSWACSRTCEQQYGSSNCYGGVSTSATCRYWTQNNSSSSCPGPVNAASRSCGCTQNTRNCTPQ